MKLEPVLFYLESGEFITVRGSNIALTQKGLKTIISIFRKFVFFLNQEYYERVSSWIGQFDVNKNNDWRRTRDVFFFIKTEPEIEKPFIEYLKSFQYIDEVDKLDLSGGFALPRGYTHLRNECNAFFNDNSKFSKNTFIMTKFDKRNAKLNETIKELRNILDAKGYKATRADDKMYISDRDMWNNVCVYMLCCKQGIAILENYSKQEYNPNVAIEYGFMRALNKSVLLLGDRRFPRYRADITGKEMLSFDISDPQTIREPVEKWLKEL